MRHAATPPRASRWAREWPWAESAFPLGVVALGVFTLFEAATSILLNTPGEAASVTTTIDGNAMARAGRGAAALATAAIGSFVAGTIATGALTLIAPSVAGFAIRLGPQDYVVLTVVAFLTVAALLGSSPARGLVSLSAGLFLGLIGTDTLTGQQRFTFGLPALADGIDAVVVAVGVFAVGEALCVASRMRHGPIPLIPAGRGWMTREDWRRSWRPWLRGTGIGFPIGTIPAGGADVATFLSYSLERRLSTRRHQFGKGAIEGVAGPEAANNAAAAGVLVPLVWALIASLYLGNVLLLVLNLPLVGVWAKLLQIPRPYLYAGILTFAALGSYAVGASRTDLILLFTLGVLGWAMRGFGYPIAPAIIGLILGPISEKQLRRTLAISRGDLTALVSSPFAITAYTCLAVFLTAGIWTKRRKVGVAGDEARRRSDRRMGR